MKSLFSVFLLSSLLFACGKIDQGDSASTSFSQVGQTVNTASIKRKLTASELTLVQNTCLALRSLRESYTTKFESSSSAKLLYNIKKSECNSQVNSGTAYKKLQKLFGQDVSWEIVNPTMSYDDIAKVETDTTGILSNFCTSTAYGTDSDAYNIISNSEGGFYILKQIIQDPNDASYVYQIATTLPYNSQQIQETVDIFRISSSASHKGLTLAKSKTSLCNSDPYNSYRYYDAEELQENASTWP